MALEDAVKKYVKDRDMLVSANFLHAIPYATIYEIIRQKIKELIVVVCSAIEEVDLLLSGNCVSKIITSYYHRAGGRRYKRELDRALFDKAIEYEDYSNFTVMSMLTAGAMGYDFLPVMKSVKESDIFKKRTFCGEDKLKTIKSPFTGKEIVVVPALNPDVAIVHVQRADKYGNAQIWGSEGTVKWSALSAEKIIVTCEEIVNHEKIRRSPFLTVIPSFRTTAVCEVPLGAHPSPVAGYYNTDIIFRSMFFTKNFSSVGNEEFMEEWVYSVKSRKDYITHYIEKYGREPLDHIKSKEFLSDQINMGYKKKYWQDDFVQNLALTREEYNELAEEKGELEL
ncbi:MAG: CoA transferase subunit A [Candidatus Lokiarchaeota archaeon]|nr:CoA transferase subunit A [Candidatus Lokiarchaeota archaeon]MBD3342842.1 CoA transferase subunit A [Candidatus Lokiarchaeota archaeon]